MAPWEAPSPLAHQNCTPDTLPVLLQKVLAISLLLPALSCEPMRFTYIVVTLLVGFLT